MRFRKIFSAFAAAVLCLCAAGCAKSSKTGSDNSSADSKKSGANTALSPVELKDYEFPEFLTESSDPDMLSNLVYTSFSQEDCVSDTTEQPFENYNCTQTYTIGEDVYYVYEDNGYVGLLNNAGAIVLRADTYSSLELVSTRYVRLDYAADSGEESDYLKIEAEHGSVDENYAFEKSNITFGEALDEDSEKTVYRLEIFGEAVYDTLWDSAEEADSDTLDTAKTYSAAYKTSTANSQYFVVFDEYYNFNIYEAAYGTIQLKIGDVYGECYILSYDDYNELDKMIESFGNESAVETPSKDESADFIEIVFGMNPDDCTRVTISADGYCFTDVTMTSDDSTLNKYFSVLSKETFVDLVNWVSDTLALEYE